MIKYLCQLELIRWYEIEITTSVALSQENDILVDEFFAVGDKDFQKKHLKE